METKLKILLNIILLFVGFVIIWNNTSLDKLRKQIKLGTNVLPDDRYFELKYKIQFLTFAFAAIIIIAGLLGLNSIAEIESDVYRKLNNITENHSKRIDTLIDIRFENAAKEIDTAYYRLLNDSKTLNSNINQYLNQVKSLNKKIGYDNMYIVNKLVIETNDSKAKIYYKDIGFKNFRRVPTIFVQAKNNSKIKLLNVTKSSFDLIIEEKKEKNVTVSLMIFN